MKRQGCEEYNCYVHLLVLLAILQKRFVLYAHQNPRQEQQDGMREERGKNPELHERRGTVTPDSTICLVGGATVRGNRRHVVGVGECWCVNSVVLNRERQGG